MRAEYAARWRLEIETRAAPLNKPQDLLRRAVSSEDYVDTAIIGGVSLADLIAGRVAEEQIPSIVIDAYKLQYPRLAEHWTFIQRAQALYDQPDQLRGFISGVKGKLFEINYVDWLNHGGLPAGWTAELASSANQMGWDIVVRDAHGDIAELLQAKAGASLDYVRQAIEANPHIDVVVPHDVFERLSSLPDFGDHLLDGHDSLTGLTEHVESAADYADAAAVHFHFPIIAIAFAVAQNHRRWRKGNISVGDAFKNIGKRSLLSIIATGAAFAACSALNSTLIGIPVSMITRLTGGQMFHNRDRRKLLNATIATVRESRELLELRVEGAILALPS